MKSRSVMFAAISAALAIAPATARSQDNSTLDEIVVEARRIPQPLSDVTGSVTVVTGEEIERKGYKTLPEALRAVPGLAVSQSGGRGTLTSVFTRGTKSEHTLIFIDGVPLTDPSSPNGAPNLGPIPLVNIDRIEIVRGPQSTLYGSDAIGGVIRIFTKRGRGPATGEVAVEGGNLNTFNQRASLRGGEGPIDFSVAAEHVRSTGYSVTAKDIRTDPADDDGFETTTASARFGIRVTDALRFDLTGRIYDTQAEFDAGSGEGLIQLGEERQAIGRAEAEYTSLEGRMTTSAAFSIGKLRREVTDTFPFDAEATTRSAEVQNDLDIGDNNTVSIGALWEEEDGAAFGTQGTLIERGVFLSDIWNYDDRFLGSAAVRWSDTEVGSKVTWQVAPAYVFRSTGTRVSASVGTAFNAPGLLQLIGFFGNPDLRPEESFGWEVGVEQPMLGDRIRVGATYFDQRIDDAIVFSGGYVNEDELDVHGVEAFVTAALTDRIDATLSYTYTRSENADGQEELRRPKHKASLAVGYRPLDDLRFTLDVDYIGERFDIVRGSSPTVRVRNGDYWLVGATGEYDLSETFTVYGQVSNLFDQDYEPVEGYQGPPLQVLGGVRARF